MPRKFRVFRAAVLAMQFITVAVRLHEAVSIHPQCERAEVAVLASNLSTHDPRASIQRFA